MSVWVYAVSEWVDELGPKAFLWSIKPGITFTDELLHVHFQFQMSALASRDELLQAHRMDLPKLKALMH